MAVDQKLIHGRQKARVMAMQALYQWAMSGAELHAIEIQYLEHNDVSRVDCSYFRELLYEIPKQLNVIDNIIIEFLDREISNINPIELAVLRLATYELKNRLDLPYKVVINEALSLAKKFGSKSGSKYVNGVIDNVAKKLRVTEISQPKNNG